MRQSRCQVQATSLLHQVYLIDRTMPFGTNKDGHQRSFSNSFNSRPMESAGWVCAYLRSRWVLWATCEVSSTRFGHFRICNVLAPPFARLSVASPILVSHFIQFFVLLPSNLGSTAPPQRAAGCDNCARGLADHAVRSRRCPESARRHHYSLDHR